MLDPPLHDKLPTTAENRDWVATATCSCGKRFIATNILRAVAVNMAEHARNIHIAENITSERGA